MFNHSDMSLHTGIREIYRITRINDWFIVYGTNSIYGNIIPYNLESYVPIHSRILAFIDNYVIIRLDGYLYALVLGNVEASRFKHKFEYIGYLKRIVPPVSLVI